MNVTKGDKKNIILERRKPKTPQKENLQEVDGRDTFQTPDYATELIIPYLSRLMSVNTIWECAAGLGKMAKRLEYDGFTVVSTDLAYENSTNFLTDKILGSFDAITTNPPFSLKRKFFMRCVEYDKPFALLIPADYSSWLIEAVDKYGCEKIVPSRRIDYITPRTLQRIHVGELFEFVKKKDGLKKDVTLRDYSTWYPSMWQSYLEDYPDYFLFDSIYDAPKNLLRKYSSCYYHSMWLTRGFNLGKTETFVELTNNMKDNI